MSYDYLAAEDPQIADAIGQELSRQRSTIELIASENIASLAVMQAMGTVLTNKYAEGYSGKRYYGGCEKVDIVEDLAIERACKLFDCKFANVQPHSGANANLAAYQALINLGDTVLGLSLDHGGHLTHGSPVNFSGKDYNVVSYGVNPETELIDYDEIERLAKEHKPKLIVGGASAYPRIIDFKRMREIADEVGAYLMFRATPPWNSPIVITAGSNGETSRLTITCNASITAAPTTMASTPLWGMAPCALAPATSMRNQSQFAMRGPASAEMVPASTSLQI